MTTWGEAGYESQEVATIRNCNTVRELLELMQE